ncbi:uncharacterized protein BT62DRAFT_925063 [Guyanagaster necrorhizus]|uniref:Uncharacterized protein n=1 Tax=Guyanagaster necrorhizus TaxID=856835 RepID=A0A9P7W4I2_9AGAR|nr:uncharacterized protein BT62DRAFT_925063 [Guyanagaster necrorhizus MCA 3950]KAG7452518.1 hypothetical protein BT62DRAFT_925063 [Guyanagaster necrorhizus MCA 3950]
MSMTELSQPKAKRRGTKRTNVAFSDDDDESDGRARDHPHSPKRARIHSTEPDTATDHHSRQHSLEPSPNVGQSDAVATKKPRKRRPSTRFVDEDDDYDVNVEDDTDDLSKASVAIPDGFHDDNEDFIDDDEEAPMKGSKKGKMKGVKAAGKGRGKIKAKSEVKETKMKDERKSISKPIPSDTQPPSSKRPKIQDTGDAPSGDSAASQLMKDDHPTQVPKKKLPTIKKNREPGPSTPLVAKSVPSAPTVPKDDFSLTNTLTSVSRKPPLVSGGDLDLSNSSVYSSLFKPAANTPRTSSNRDAERRKELNKLREEARTKRELEANCHFNLQGDMEKILRFEDRLRSIRSPTVYPNVLGAKWKEQWERDKRHRVQTTSRDVGDSREEGEM